MSISTGRILTRQQRDGALSQSALGISGSEKLDSRAGALPPIPLRSPQRLLCRSAPAPYGWVGLSVAQGRLGVSREISLSPMRTRWNRSPQPSETSPNARKAEARSRRLKRSVGEALRRSERLAATGRLSASLAHEINNPLSTLTIFSSCSTRRRICRMTPSYCCNRRRRKWSGSPTSPRKRWPASQRRGTRKVMATELVDASVESFHRQIAEGNIQVERHYGTEAKVDVTPTNCVRSSPTSFPTPSMPCPREVP